MRVIPTLLYKDFGLVKGVGFDSRRHVGSAVQAVKVYNLRGVDELVFLDVAATREEREPDFTLVDDLADECFMPLTVGGGIRDVDSIQRMLKVGADKVSLNTAVHECPSLVAEAARRYGSQCIVVSIDTRDDGDGRATAWTRSGTTPTGRDPVEVAGEVESAGAGEILLQSADRDGTMAGYDLATIQRVSEAVSIPVIASGGAGGYEDMVKALQAGAAAVAAASIFHFTQATPMEAKQHLSQAGFPVRL